MIAYSSSTRSSSKFIGVNYSPWTTLDVVRVSTRAVIRYLVPVKGYDSSTTVRVVPQFIGRMLTLLERGDCMDTQALYSLSCHRRTQAIPVKRRHPQDISVFFRRSEGPMRVWHAAAQRFARELPRAAEAADGARVRAVHTTERTDVRQLLPCNRHSAQQLHITNMSPVPRSCPTYHGACNGGRMRCLQES